jgi:5-formyltetrahydrofolate cyclo-ligase
MQDKHALRRQLRAVRKRLTPKQQSLASQRAARRLARLLVFARAGRIAAYVARGGELDPAPALKRALRRGKRCYLPVLHPFDHSRLWFLPWHPGTAMRTNRYGIPEPRSRHGRIAPRRLDVVLVPLVGFDLHGTRLGMGGGYYDRTFAFRRRAQRLQRPLLIGYAHAEQQVERLPHMPWDITLDWVVTDRSVHRIGSRHASR